MLIHPARQVRMTEINVKWTKYSIILGEQLLAAHSNVEVYLPIVVVAHWRMVDHGLTTAIYTGRSPTYTYYLRHRMHH